MDKSAFKLAHLVTVSPNLVKKQVIVEVAHKRKVEELRKIEKLGNVNVKCFLPFNDRIKSNFRCTSFSFGRLRQNRYLRKDMNLTDASRINSYCMRVYFLLGDSLPSHINIDHHSHKVQPFNHSPL